MDAERHVEFLRLGEEHIVIVVAVRLARRGELHHPSALVTGLDRAFEFGRRGGGIAQREMRHRNQAAAAVRRPVGDPAVVGAAHRLRVLGIVGIGLPGQIEAGINDRGVESFLVES